MNACLVDTNVFLDYFLNRNGADDAIEILNLCEVGRIAGFVSAHEITTMSYYLEKGVKDRSKVIEIIGKTIKTFTIIETNDRILGMALFSNVNDYEDAVIEVASMERKIDYIITKNIKDFKNSRIKAILPSEFLKLI